MLELESIAFEILKQYQKKLGIVNEICRLTQEMDQLLAVDDRGSAQLVLEMRQVELEKADRCSTDIVYLEESMPKSDRDRLRQVLTAPGGEAYAEKLEEKKIWEIDSRIKQILLKVIEVDKHVSQRISGTDSFYNQRK